MFGLSNVVEMGLGILDKVIPDPDARVKAKHDLIVLQQQGEFKQLEARMSAIVAEAQSADPWTSRARPSFLYVMYALILSAVPMGFLTSYFPNEAAQVTAGFNAWLAAIPEPMWWLFGSGYLGYSVARSHDKRLPLIKKGTP